LCLPTDAARLVRARRDEDRADSPHCPHCTHCTHNATPRSPRRPHREHRSRTARGCDADSTPATQVEARLPARRPTVRTSRRRRHSRTNASNGSVTVARALLAVGWREVRRIGGQACGMALSTEDDRRRAGYRYADTCRSRRLGGSGELGPVPRPRARRGVERGPDARSVGEPGTGDG
jgi:hypothetical protein